MRLHVPCTVHWPAARGRRRCWLLSTPPLRDPGPPAQRAARQPHQPQFCLLTYAPVRAGAHARRAAFATVQVPRRMPGLHAGCLLGAPPYLSPPCARRAMTAPPVMQGGLSTVQPFASLRGEAGPQAQHGAAVQGGLRASTPARRQRGGAGGARCARPAGSPLQEPAAPSFNRRQPSPGVTVTPAQPTATHLDGPPLAARASSAARPLAGRSGRPVLHCHRKPA